MSSEILCLHFFIRHYLFEAVNFSVSMEENPSGKIQICTIYCRILGLNLLSIYLSDCSITSPYRFIQKYLFFCTKIKHSGCSFPWALPTPGLWNKIGISGNTIDADGIRLGTAAFFTVRCPRLSFSTDTVSVVPHRGL